MPTLSSNSAWAMVVKLAGHTPVPANGELRCLPVCATLDSYRGFRMGVYEKWPGGTGICRRALEPGVQTAQATVGFAPAVRHGAPPLVSLVTAALDVFLKCDCNDVGTPAPTLSCATRGSRHALLIS